MDKQKLDDWITREPDNAAEPHFSRAARVRLLTHGTKKNYRCVLYDCETEVMSDTFEEHGQAWAYGQNWKMLNKNYSYDIAAG